MNYQNATDILYIIMPGETEEDNYDQIEQIQSLTKNIIQSLKPSILPEKEWKRLLNMCCRG